MKNHFWSGIATLNGMIIGAGIFGIPYVIQKSGFLLGTIEILAIGIAMLIINMYMGEITLRTDGDHQLTGYAERYLGQKGKWIMGIALIISLYGGLTAYLIGEMESISLLFNISELGALIWFIVFAGTILFIGLKFVEESELIMNIVKALLFVIIFIVVSNSGKFTYSNFTGMSFPHIFAPLGVILFAFYGISAIPEVREELRGNWKDMGKIILVGSIIPIVVYILFSFLVVGITGASTSEVATISLSLAFSNTIMVLINLFAIVTLATAFIAIGYALQTTFTYDFGMDKRAAFFLVLIVPLVMIALGFESFVGVLGITGAISGSIVGTIIVLMHKNSKRMGTRIPEYTIKNKIWVDVTLITLFACALFVELISFL